MGPVINFFPAPRREISEAIMTLLPDDRLPRYLGINGFKGWSLVTSARFLRVGRFFKVFADRKYKWFDHPPWSEFRAISPSMGPRRITPRALNNSVFRWWLHFATFSRSSLAQS